MNSTDVGAMSPSNHFTFQCPLLNSQPQFKGFDICGWLVHDVSSFPEVWFVLFVFCFKTDAQGGRKLPSIFFMQLITNSLFFVGRYFLRNNSSHTSLRELNFDFSYRVQVNFLMTLNSSSCISFSSVLMDEFFLFLETLQYSHCQQKHGMLVRIYINLSQVCWKAFLRQCIWDYS